MSELKAITDFTIADRLSTQLQYEVKIKELVERLQKVEAELVKHKSIFKIDVDPNSGVIDLSVELNGKVKQLKVAPSQIDEYLGNSDPTGAILRDIIDILVQPYREVMYQTYVETIQAVVKNRKSLVNRKGL